MMMPSIFGENLFDEWMNFPFERDFFGERNPLYGKHADVYKRQGLSWLIEITVMNEDIRVEEEITYLELSKKYKEMFDGPIMGVRVGNTLKELTAKVSDGEEIVFVDPSRPCLLYTSRCV